MLKRLVVVGNSLALVIDRPTLRLLRIKRDTELRVSTDGHRLIVEPIRPVMWETAADDGKRTFVERGRVAARILQMLEREPGFDACFEQLSEGMRSTTYGGYVENAMRGTPVVERIMARLDVCVEGVRGGQPLGELVAIALEAVPVPPAVAS